MTDFSKIPAAALSTARSEGRAWASEIAAGCRHDAEQMRSWVDNARQDQQGWWANCAFDTVRDGVEAEVWAEWKLELSEACATACFEEMKRLAA